MINDMTNIITNGIHFFKIAHILNKVDIQRNICYEKNNFEKGSQKIFSG